MNYFSETYEEAKQKFLHASTNTSGTTLTSLTLSTQNSYSNEPLTTELTYIGPPQPKTLFIHSSGVHGVEGFAGSAVQTRLLTEYDFEGDSDVGVLFVHVVNPYGMSYWRRWNENNVDLNRNCMDEEQWENHPETHPRYHDTVENINPPNEPMNWAASYIFNALKILYQNSFNMGQVKQIIAGGQYEYPNGIFYAGNSTEELPTKIFQYLSDNFSAVENVVVLDVHTGLGAFGYDTMLINRDFVQQYPQEFLSIMDDHLDASILGGEGIAYDAVGSFPDRFHSLFPNSQVFSATQEFGTYHSLQVLKCLIQENYYFNHTDQLYGNDERHWASEHVLRAFYPDSREWETTILERGFSMFHQFYTYAQSL
eukprot:TRINITY_DN11702_c0_g1_i1.p1 TRINITY_DN11702_c0_g1~~TRINITY_DN11702_c0_g1_i1.p1  ORF type:complete len:368 (-),score=69.40 TRINITY_DN11702_c0_g1_i1:22-1125(-)